MQEIIFHKLNYNEFAPTRYTIQQYAQLLSAIKGSLVTHQKNWEEFSLKIYAKGFTTTPIQIKTGEGLEALDLNLNLVENKLKIFYKDIRDEIDFEQNTLAAFTKQLLEKLDSYGIKVNKVDDKFFTEEKLIFNPLEAQKLWNLFRQIYFLLLEFRGLTLFETSSINFWPHHFDLSLLIFSGKIINGQDPENWDYSREQMNFGFSTGDEKINQPYFYITAYHFRENLFDLELPEFAEWNKEGWKGVLIKLERILDQINIGEKLIKIFKQLLGNNYSG